MRKGRVICNEYNGPFLLLEHGTEGEGDLENAVSNCLRSVLFTRTVS